MKVSDVRGASIILSVEMLLKAVDSCREGQLVPYPQDLNRGRQYFVMHRYLFEVLEGRLKTLIDNNSHLEDAETRSV
jgi:hypothetical protein